MQNKHLLLQTANYVEDFADSLVLVINEVPSLSEACKKLKGMSEKRFFSYSILMELVADEMKEILKAIKKDGTGKTFDCMSTTEAIERFERLPAHQIIFEALKMIEMPKATWFAFIGIKKVRNVLGHCIGWIEADYSSVLCQFADTLPPRPYHELVTNTFPDDVRALAEIHPWWRRVSGELAPMPTLVRRIVDDLKGKVKTETSTEAKEIARGLRVLHKVIEVAEDAGEQEGENSVAVKETTE